MAKITNILTPANFAFPISLEKGPVSYIYQSGAGDVEITITEKVSNFGTGKLTVYSGKYGDLEITRKPIGHWKNVAKAVVNHREGTTIKAVKVLSDSELSDFAAKAITDFGNALEHIRKVFAKYGVSDGNGDGQDDLTLAVSLLNLVDSATDFGTKARAYAVTLNERAKAEKAAAEKAAAEKAAKAEKRELAKAVTNLSDIQAEMIKAVIAGDFAKVDELKKAMKSA